MTAPQRTPLVVGSDSPHFAAFRAAALLHRHLKFHGPEHEKTTAALKHAVAHFDGMTPSAQKLVRHAMKRVVQNQVAGDMHRKGPWRLTASADDELDALMAEACADLATMAKEHGGTDDTPGFHTFSEPSHAGRFAKRARNCGHEAQVIGSKAGKGGLTVQVNPRRPLSRSMLAVQASRGMQLDRQRLGLPVARSPF